MKEIIYRRTPLSDTLNFRDLGGYATQNGGITRWNVFFRSACPNSINKADEETLRNLGITDIIDLRGGDNADEVQRGYTSLTGFNVYNIPVGGGIPPKTVSECPESYLQIAESERMRDVFKIIAEAKGAVLFHCFAGKDRTGVVAALLLMLADVYDEDIIADYTLSYTYFLSRIRSDFLRFDAEKDVFKPLPDHMEGFMRVFREKYGDVRSYLLQAGFANSQINAIVGKFVVGKERKK
ncbi:MAG: tyrosine-protein phosphatase [Corallococcus sp.]|nr:tyrosine-protein phosphatase [Bacillota bacterium]MCM1533618.1 tyrosine-protein phosphatase [Corallococcus sp.]